MARLSADVLRVKQTLEAAWLEEVARGGTPEEGDAATERFSAALEAHEKALSKLPAAERAKWAF
jgi:hypothetical protein